MKKRMFCFAALAVCALLCAACSGGELPPGASETGTTPASDAAAPDSAVPETPPDATPAEPPDEEAPAETVEMQTVEHAMPAQEGVPDEVRGVITGSSWFADSPVALEDLAYLEIPYLDFDGEARVGEMIVHRELAGEVREIFAELYDAGFPIAGMRLIDEFGADDAASMEANNTYAFCTRLILGTGRYSQHAYGVAVDINPVQNPYVVQGGVYPGAARAYLDRGDVRPGMIVPGDACHTAFVSRGWSWGGDWPDPDYQHFEKSVG